MKIISFRSQPKIAWVLFLAGCILPVTSSVFAQSGTQGSGSSSRNPFNAQGSDNRNAGSDPFQLPPRGGDQFQLPGVPPLEGSGSAQQPAFPQFQSAEVNEKFAGWRQASDGLDGNRLDNTLRSNWVMTDVSGNVSGIVYGIEGADLGDLRIILLENGREVKSVSPKEDGTFTFANLREGSYAMVGWGENAFFAFGVNVIDFNTAADAEVATELKVTATQNETTINTDWIQYYATQVKFPVYGRHSSGETDTDPARLFGYRGQSSNLPESTPQTSISSHQVIPASDGRVIGPVHQMATPLGRPFDLRHTRIWLLKNDDVYAAVTTDSYGVFEFPPIPGGEYSCVAVGQDGIGCIGIFLADAQNVESGLDDLDDDEEFDSLDGDEDGRPEFTPIAFTMVPSEGTGWLNNIAIETAYKRVITRPRPPEQMEQNQDCMCNNQPRHNCQPGALRPGGYRPGPRGRVPAEERFFQKANRFVDSLFFRDDQTIDLGTGNQQPPAPRN